MATLGHPNPVIELHDALDALLCPQVVDSPYGPVVLPSLLDQLQEAAEPSGGTGSGRANMYKSPASLDVVVLLASIDKHSREALRRAQYRQRFDMSRTDLLRALQLVSGDMRQTSAGSELLYALICEAKRWSVRARAILTPDPQTIETQAQPCPVCKARTAFVWSDDAGEKVQRPSLYLDKDTMTVHCRCCSSHWGPRMWSFLRRLLDDNRTATDNGHSAR